uniref:Endonuclease n=1 Tax=Ditylenchus dipsaci TaxID=166011 RepID=A0A915EHF3_9BILA
MVVEHLTPDRLVYDPSVGRSKSTFKPDTSIHTFFQSQNSDYLRSGYDRGHLAAAGNHRKSRNSIDQTFFLTNMSPHVGRGFNRDKWNDVEIHVRRLAKKNRNVYICTGPLYLPQKKSDGNFYTFPKSILCSMINYFNRFRHYLTDTAPLSSSNAETEEEEDEMLPARRRDAESGSKSKSSSSYRTPSSTTPKLKRSETERPYKPAPKTSTQSNAMESSEESSKEESSTARLSRRSSVLGDLFALFRRSSSFGLGGRYPAQGYRDHDYDSDDSEDEERQQEMSKEKLLQKIRQNKEIIGKVRMQPWAMKRKRRTLKVAQRQVKHQEARVSKWHLYKVLALAKECINLFDSVGGQDQKNRKSFWVCCFFILYFSSLDPRSEHHHDCHNHLFIIIPEWLADSQATKFRFNRTQHHKLIPKKTCHMFLSSM